MSWWWWVPIGLAAWLLVGLAVGLCLGPVLRRSSQAWDAQDRLFAKLDVQHQPPLDERQAS